MVTPRRDSTLTPNRDTVQPDNGAQRMKPLFPVLTTADSELREQKTTEGNILPNDTAPQISTITQIESSRETRLSFRLRTAKLIWCYSMLVILD